MRKHCAFILLILLAVVPAAGLEVDIDELKKAGKIEFINYTGPRQNQDSVAVVKSIGSGLAAEAQKRGENARVHYYTKYSLIRAISKEEPEKFSADIFSINKNARVTHIRYIRHILSGYFERMYGYSGKNAYTLAVFTTYYNAVYRGDVEYFGKAYKKVVTGNLTPRNAGLSTRYDEWPGATRIVIPLSETAKRGEIDSIDPDIISDRKVRTAIRKEDENLEQRKDLVDLKEKIIEKDKKETAEKKADLVKEAREVEKEKKRIEDEKADLERKKREQDREEQKLKDEKEKAKSIRDAEEKKKKEEEITVREEKLKQEKQKTAEKEKAVATEERKVAEKKGEIKKEEKRVAEKESKIAKKEESLKEEKKEIEKDELKKDIKESPEKAKAKLEEKEKELDKREDELRSKELDKSVFAEKLYYLKIREYLEAGHYNNEMYMINAAARRVMFKSPVENICGSRYDVFSGGVAVIVHQGDHKTGHRLMLLDRETLKESRRGKDDVFWRSFVEVRDGFIYAVTVENGKYYLGRYDGSLARTARSQEQVSENTFISFYGEYVYINRHDKKILVLKKADLSLVEVIEPK
ncbi:MAG TPA: P83/100 family protein [Spirochaetota bacterium]|nr:P83/100 family protein [Spirochaetota bacterium]